MKITSGALALALVASFGCVKNTPTDIVEAEDGGVTPFDSGSTPPMCRVNTVYCEGNTRYQCTASGEIVNRVTCTGSAPMCVPNVGCRACVPNQTRCDPASPNQTQRCRADGAGWENGPACDAAEGSMCVSGVCVDRCSESATGRSYLGCDYWPTITANSQLDPNFEFAIVLSNPQSYAVRATITGGGLSTPRIVNLAPGAIETVSLPWVQELVSFLPTFGGCRGGSDPGCRVSRMPARSAFRRNGAYHVHTNGPVAAYQFNPLNFSRAGGYYSFTNDASLLLPQGVLRQRYVVSTWPNWVIRNGTQTMVAGGFVTIVGVAGESTTVTVRPTASVSAGPGVPMIPAGGSQTFSLQPGDVVQLISADDRVTASGRGPDLTGTTIESSLPIAVFVGHDCTNIPETRVACDHLEEQLLPNETWGRDYFVSALRDRGPTNPGVVRVVSQSDDNQISFDPPSIYPSQMLRAGQVLEFATNQHFRVTGTRAFLVSQFMIGQGPATTVGAGDPAMVFEVPVQQYRNQYDFYVPTTYPQNFLNIVTPSGTQLTMDNSPVRGSVETVSGYDIYTLPIASGAHRIRSASSMPFGIKVYGIASYTSYMYPGGLDLQLITPG